MQKGRGGAYYVNSSLIAIKYIFSKSIVHGYFFHNIILEEKEIFWTLTNSRMEPAHVKKHYSFLTEYICPLSKMKETEAYNMQLKVL